MAGSAFMIGLLLLLKGRNLLVPRKRLCSNETYRRHNTTPESDMLITYLYFTSLFFYSGSSANDIC
jgi:hypothetical protein